MSAALFDVIIVGHNDLSPGAQLKLAGTIAARHSVPAPQVAEALAGGRCVIGKQLPEPAARRLVADLTALGARADLHPPISPPRQSSPPAPSRPSPRPRPISASPPPNPIKRAFIGLAIALAIGFVPAAYYSFGISGAEVRRIRARQAQLSDQPGEKPILDEFDRLDAAVAEVRHRGLIHTAVLWVLISGIAGGAIYRLGRSERT